MKRALLSLLADPQSGTTLDLCDAPQGDKEVVSGILANANGGSYPVRTGIPRFVTTADSMQLQTRDAFAYKWRKRETYDSPAMKSFTADWLTEKYGFGSLTEWASYFDSRNRILDLGCGSGLSSSVWLDTDTWSGEAMWVGADISEAIDVASDRLSHIPNTHFVQADAMQPPFRSGSFDTIFSEGVLHHTPSTRLALHQAATLLVPGGEIHFYVYRKKGPIREFTDDYVREQLQALSNEEAWETMRSLTRLGKALAELDVQVELEEDVPILGMKAGQHDLQRLLYYDVCKMYWNSTLSFEENVHVNFDWYRPCYAHRQTADEIRQWCSEASLRITWFHEQQSGFTVRATKETHPCAA